MTGIALSHVAEVVALAVVLCIFFGLIVAVVAWVLEDRSASRDEQMRDYYKQFRRLP